MKLPDNYYDDPAARGWLCDECGADIHSSGEHDAGCSLDTDQEDPDRQHDEMRESGI